MIQSLFIRYAPANPIIEPAVLFNILTDLFVVNTLLALYALYEINKRPFINANKVIVLITIKSLTPNTLKSINVGKNAI